MFHCYGEIVKSIWETWFQARHLDSLDTFLIRLSKYLQAQEFDIQLGSFLTLWFWTSHTIINSAVRVICPASYRVVSCRVKNLIFRKAVFWTLFCSSKMAIRCFAIVFAIAFLLASFVNKSDSACTSRSYRATTSYQYIRKYSYGNNEDCTFYISPSSYYYSGYFLQIQWYYNPAFSVNGVMPRCTTDYVEVFLTR